VLYHHALTLLCGIGILGYTSAFASPQYDGVVELFGYNIDSDKKRGDNQVLSLGGAFGVGHKPTESITLYGRFYTVSPLMYDGVRKSLGGTFNAKGKGITTLGVAYAMWEHQNHSLRIGRQQLSTPMANDDTTRTIPYTYEAITYHYHTDPIILQLGVIKNIKANHSDDFIPHAGTGAMKVPEGVRYGGIDYRHQNFSGHGFIYNAPDLYDALHLQSEYRMEHWQFGIQHIRTEKNRGGQHIVFGDEGTGDVNILAGKVTYHNERFSAMLAYSQNDDNGGISRAYGGYTKLYTSSMYETAKRAYGAMGTNLTLGYGFDEYPEWSLHATLLKVDYRRQEGNAFLSSYAEVRYRTTKERLRIRYEDVDREYGDERYMRIIATHYF